MKNRSVLVNDPDFGSVAVRAIPVRRTEWNAFRERIRRKLAASSLWRPGVSYRCPSCGARALHASSDITQEVRRGSTLVVLRNLKGAQCRECHYGLLDLAEALRIDDEFDQLEGPAVPARVSAVGRGTVGTYWPKAIERALRLQPGRSLTIRVLSPSSILVHVGEVGRAEARRKGRPTAV